MNIFDRRFILVLAVASFGAVGCAPMQPKPTASPSEARSIPLNDAVADVQAAIANMYSKERKAGIIASKATVTLKLTAVEDTADHKWTVGVTLPSGAGLSGSREGGNTSSNTFENTVQIEFSNPVLADKDSVLGQRAATMKPTDSLSAWMEKQLGPVYGIQ